MGNIEWKAVIINNFLHNSFSKEFELKLGQDQNPKISTILTLNQSSLTDFFINLNFNFHISNYDYNLCTIRIGL